MVGGCHHSMRNCYRVSALGRLRTAALTWVSLSLSEYYFQGHEIPNLCALYLNFPYPCLKTASYLPIKAVTLKPSKTQYVLPHNHCSVSLPQNLCLPLLQASVQVFCFKLVRSSGVPQLLYASDYRSPRVYHYLRSDCIQINLQTLASYFRWEVSRVLHCRWTEVALDGAKFYEELTFEFKSDGQRSQLGKN